MSFVWSAVAIGGGALLNYMGSQNAASAQTNAANNANATQQSQYNQTRQDQLPWMNRGNAAGNQMAYLMGLPGYGPTNGGSLGSAMEGRVPRPRPDGVSPNDWAAYGPMQGSDGDSQPQEQVFQPNTALGGYGSLLTPFSQTNWQADPGYAFRLAEGQKALERSGAARGMTLSGAQAKALQGYGQGMASQEYGNAYNRYNQDQTNVYNRLAGVAGTGQQANQFVGSLGANMANQVSANQIGAGNAVAGGIYGGYGAITNGINNWMSANPWGQANQSYSPMSQWNVMNGADTNPWGAGMGT